MNQKTAKLLNKYNYALQGSRAHYRFLKREYSKLPESARTGFRDFMKWFITEGVYRAQAAENYPRT